MPQENEDIKIEEAEFKVPKDIEKKLAEIVYDAKEAWYLVKQSIEAIERKYKFKEYISNFKLKIKTLEKEKSKEIEITTINEKIVNIFSAIEHIDEGLKTNLDWNTAQVAPTCRKCL